MCRSRKGKRFNFYCWTGELIHWRLCRAVNVFDHSPTLWHEIDFIWNQYFWISIIFWNIMITLIIIIIFGLCVLRIAVLSKSINMLFQCRAFACMKVSNHHGIIYLSDFLKLICWSEPGLLKKPPCFWRSFFITRIPCSNPKLRLLHLIWHHSLPKIDNLFTHVCKYEEALCFSQSTITACLHQENMY